MSNLTAENQQELVNKLNKLVNKYGFEDFTLVLENDDNVAVISNSNDCMKTSLEVIEMTLEHIQEAEAEENSVDALEDTLYGHLLKSTFPTLWENMPTEVEHDLYLKFKDMDEAKQACMFQQSITVLELMNKVTSL